MKIAIFADVHGNYHALEAVLDDIERERVDVTVCAGDMINPFPDSLRVWRKLKALNIPMVRGNHEDYILTYHNSPADNEIRTGVQFKPVQLLAQQLDAQTLAEIAALPLSLTIPGPGDDDVLVCHASPSSNSRSYAIHFDNEMTGDLTRISAKTIVGGHIHMQWEQRWQDKWLLLTGSVGLAFEGVAAADYLLLRRQNGRWRAEFRAVPYNRQAAADALTKNGFLRQGGPIAWLMFDELATSEMRLVPFLSKFCPKPKPVTLPDWEKWTQRYLEAIGRWGKIKPYVEVGNGEMPNAWRT